MRIPLYCLATLGAAAMLLGGCTSAPSTTSEKTQLHTDCMAAVSDFKAMDSGMDNLLQNQNVAGYAILPSIGKGAAGIGGAYGQGELYENGNRVGYVEMNQGTVGATLGAETYSELIVFQNRDALERFKAGNWSFAADTSAVAIKSGVAADAKFQSGTAVFVNPKGGLMGEAAIGGQKFTYEPL